MEEYKLDEEFVMGFLVEFKAYLEAATKQIEILTNREEDIFKRYFAYISLQTALSASTCMAMIGNNCLVRGFNLHHYSLKTDNALYSNWKEPRLDEDPLFKKITPESSVKNEDKSDINSA